MVDNRDMIWEQYPQELLDQARQRLIAAEAKLVSKPPEDHCTCTLRDVLENTFGGR